MTVAFIVYMPLRRSFRSLRLALLLIALIVMGAPAARAWPGGKSTRALVTRAKSGLKRAGAWLRSRSRPLVRQAAGERKPGTLVLVRHGQSIWNLQNRFTGWTDVPLTDKGRAEARQAGKLVKEIAFDRAYTSKLQRAEESLQLMMQSYGKKLPVRRSKALNERHYGLLQGLNKAETARRLGEDLVHRWRRSWDVAPPGGESLKQTAARTMPYFERNILREVKRGRNVLVVAHGNSLRSIVKELDRLSPEQVCKLQIDTGVPLVYQIGSDGKVVSKCVRR
jgi:2,3-bisphosphoglycerate-dependent phosphoglycerate mutase